MCSTAVAPAPYLPLVGRSDRRSGWGAGAATPTPLLRSDPPHKGEGK